MAHALDAPYFVGSSDLVASMRLLGEQTHPGVVAAVKRVDVNAFAQDQARDYLAAGADFVNVGADVALLAAGARNLAGASRGSG